MRHTHSHLLGERVIQLAWYLCPDLLALLCYDCIALRLPIRNVLERKGEEDYEKDEEDHKDQGKGHHCFHDGLWGRTGCICHEN